MIPLQYLGACNTDLSSVTTDELMQYALANLDQHDKEGGYAVRHGSKPMNSFGRPRAGATDEERRQVLANNPMSSAFPTLFPYDEGGIESERPRAVSFTEHVRWALQYYDRRFRIHHSFPFIMFGIEQKRQALSLARVQMSRRDLQRDSAALGQVTLEDLKQAAEEEKRGERPSNPGVRKLKKHLKAVSSKVLGSDDARAANRSKIWSTTVMKSPPSLWITLNPADLHDPIAQVLAGEDIDMDAFIEAVGPDKDRRARNIARDPYAAAKFYDFVVKTLFKTLFKIDASGSSVKSDRSIFGTISAYFGVTEAQGRGTLHLHLVVWLEGAPTMEEMKKHLQDAEFREKLVKYIQANIRCHLDGFS